MFISKERNFIYLRVPKTGSTSMMNYLRDNLGNNEGTTYTLMNIFEWEGKNLPIGQVVLRSKAIILTGNVVANSLQINNNVYFQ